MKKLSIEEIATLGKNIATTAIKEVKATTIATSTIATMLPACALNKRDIGAYLVKGESLTNFQCIMGEQEFDRLAKDYSKRISERRFEECRNNFLANCDGLFNTLVEGKTFVEVLHEAILIKLEDAYMQTLKDIKREAINEVLRVLEGINDEEAILNMGAIPFMVQEIIPSLVNTDTNEVEDLMTQAAESLTEEVSNVLQFVRPQVYMDDKIQSILTEASKWLTEEVAEEVAEEVNLDISTEKHCQDLIVYEEVVGLVERIVKSKKFRLGSLDKVSRIMEVMATALVVSDRRLSFASNEINGGFETAQTLKFVQEISLEIKSQRKRIGFENCIFNAFAKSRSIADEAIFDCLKELAKYAI